MYNKTLHHSKKATSIVEVIVSLLVIVSGIVGLYAVYGESMDLSLATKNKIIAIQMAREGIEVMKNIRDTNILLYGADPGNCWNTFNYNAACINDPSDTHDIASGAYYPSRNGDNRWVLNNFFELGGIKIEEPVGTDSNGFYIQGTGSTVDISPNFFREIVISYLKSDGSEGDSNDQTMKVQSKVYWSEKGNKRVVSFDTYLTNWKQ